MAEDNRSGAPGAPSSAVPSHPTSSEATTSKRFGKKVNSWMDDLVSQGRADAAEVSVEVRVDDDAPPSWTYKPLVPGAPPPAVRVEEPPPASPRPYFLAAGLAFALLVALSTWLLLR
jgi:hypothetical protein